MPWMLAVGGLASLAGGVINAISQSSANDRAAMIQNENLQKWLQLNVPNPEEQKIVVQKFVQQGELDPRMQEAIKQDPSAFEKIVTNPTYSAAQDRALQQLEQIGEEGGLRLQDKAALQDAQQRAAVQERANREGIAAEMARRGMGGSGYDVAARLSGQQSVADRLGEDSLKTAAMAQDRALQAIEGAGNLGTQYRNQAFGEAAQKASAADRINAFNVANARDVNAANTAAQNRAQEMNLAAKQDVSNRNVDMTNQNRLRNANLIQQNYENQMRKMAGMSGQYEGLANTAQRAGQIAGNTASNIASGIGGAASSAAQYQYLDDYLKNKASKG